jgi:wyosine [tRNA(Phe)-imidazoG37] synthetase (radical SAM superfamily)
MLSALTERVVQGPLENERHGRHLLVDPTCETNRPDTHPTQAVVITTAARRIIELSKAGEKLGGVVLVGQPDPMLHREFRDIAENLKELCKKWYPKVVLTLETRGLNLGTADLRHCLTLFDRPLVRFEYGTQKTFAALTGRKPQDLKDVAENIGRIDFERWVVEACFVRGEVDNTTDSELRAWMKYIEDWKPGGVRVTTTAKPNTELKTKPVTKTKLQQIAEKTTEKCGVPVEVVDPS